MDSDYVIQHLFALCKVMYTNGEPFAKFSKERDLYIFGAIYPFGKTIKSVVHKSIAIYIILNKLIEDDSKVIDKRIPIPQTHHHRTKRRS